MRYSPTGTHIVFERGQNAADGPRRLEVVDAATGALVATFRPGAKIAAKQPVLWGKIDGTARVDRTHPSLTTPTRIGGATAWLMPSLSQRNGGPSLATRAAMKSRTSVVCVR